MAQQQGKIRIVGTSTVSGTPGSFTMYSPSDGTTAVISGYVSPVITGINLQHAVESAMNKDHKGDVVGVVTHGEHLEATFELIPEGSTLANALKSATIPPDGATIVITGLDVIQVGTFPDALNVSGSTLPTSARWIYMGGASIRETNDPGQPAALSVPAKRFPLITGGTAVSD